MQIESLIKLALLNNDTVYANVSKTKEGFANIDTLRAVDGTPPLIEFHLLGGGDTMILDDEVFRERYTYQIIYVSKDKRFIEVGNEIKKAMRGVGFRITSEYSLQNQYTNLMHWYIHVSQSFDDTWYQNVYNKQLEIAKTKKRLFETALPSGEYYNPDMDDYEILE